MDHRVSWSPTALDDVDAIAEYINRDSPAYTRAVVNKIRDTARKLKDFPSIGRIVAELDEGADTSEKADNGRGGVSCQKEENTRRSSNVKPVP